MKEYKSKVNEEKQKNSYKTVSGYNISNVWDDVLMKGNIKINGKSVATYDVHDERVDSAQIKEPAELVNALNEMLYDVGKTR